MKCEMCNRKISPFEDRWLYDASGREFVPEDDLCEDCFGKMVNEGRAEMVGAFMHVRGLAEDAQICDECGNALEVAKLRLAAHRTYEKVNASRSHTLLVRASGTGETYMSNELGRNEYAICRNCDRLLTADDIRSWNK